MGNNQTYATIGGPVTGKVPTVEHTCRNLDELWELVHHHPTHRAFWKSKPEWEPGPWDNEECDVLAETLHGYRVLAKRNVQMGHWCGYIHVPRRVSSSDACEMQAHGGITYPQDADGWIGFDAAHMGDVVPGVFTWTGMSNAVYFSFVSTVIELYAITKTLKELDTKR